MCAHLSEQLVQLADDVGRRRLRRERRRVIKANDERQYSLNGCYLQEHFAAVDAHRIHGAEGHESDGDRRRRVHCVIVTEHTAVKVL